jgi:hypothetical protein
METIINLLKDKNYHLQKFYQLNEDELVRFGQDNFDNLEIFYQSRETILDLVRCIDRLVETAASVHTEPTHISSQYKREMMQAMGAKNELVSLILAQDLQILSVIEQAKSNIIKELRQVSTAKKAVGAYKSGDTVSKLNEKA